MKNLLNIAARALMAAAHQRASKVMRKQAEIGQPWKADFRSNAGGWN